MSVAATVSSSLAAGMVVTVTCERCTNSTWVDLAAMARRGQGHRDLDDLPLVCRCGWRRYRVTVSDPDAARAFGGGVGLKK